MKSIDKLSIVDTGHGEGAARLSNYVTSLMATAPEMLKNVSGIDVNQLIKGLTQKSNLIKQQSDIVQSETAQSETTKSDDVKRVTE